MHFYPIRYFSQANTSSDGKRQLAHGKQLSNSRPSTQNPSFYTKIGSLMLNVASFWFINLRGGGGRLALGFFLCFVFLSETGFLKENLGFAPGGNSAWTGNH